MKKRKTIWLHTILLFTILGYTFSILKEYYSFAEEIIVMKTGKAYKKDTITIIFIGDSWASYHSKYDQKLKRCIESRLNKPVKVISRGSVGAKTKFIYTAMYDDSPTGTKELIEQSPDYAIVSAGINDAVAKMGTEYYCHHYNLIIKRLLSAGIKPIIIDMPQVDYIAIYQRESLTAQIRHHISSWLTQAPFWSFDEYRIALQTMITQNQLKAQLIYIPASEWNPEGYADTRMLYQEDHAHLNEKGYSLLDSCITSHIYKDYKTTLGFQ